MVATPWGSLQPEDRLPGAGRFDVDTLMANYLRLRRSRIWCLVAPVRVGDLS